jgi:hypothetical protein
MPSKIQGLMLIALVAFVGLSSSVVPAQQKAQDDLHTRAKAAGGKLVWRYRPTRRLIYPNVEELAKRSDIIVVGRTLGHRSGLTSDGRFVTQDFLVRVQEVFKGDLPNGQSILISLPGGSYKFPDGTHVSVMPNGFKQAEDGTSYVFFLKDKPKNGKAAIYKGHRLVSEVQGLFALKDGKIEPASASPSDPIAKKYQGTDPKAFLARLHEVYPTKKKK